jgi:hypothetical protein
MRDKETEHRVYLVEGQPAVIDAVRRSWDGSRDDLVVIVADASNGLGSMLAEMDPTKVAEILEQGDIPTSSFPMDFEEALEFFHKANPDIADALQTYRMVPEGHVRVVSVDGRGCTLMHLPTISN